MGNICTTCGDKSCKRRRPDIVVCTRYEPCYEVRHIAKHDEGKLQIHLVPPQIIRDIAEVRMYGNEKYGDPDNWKTVEKWRYVDALLRHLLLYLEDPNGVDEESGIKHYKHAACNMAFICEMENKNEHGSDSSEYET